MYLKIGNTKLFASKYSIKGLTKIEINFEYLFSSHKSDRRFANIVADFPSQEFKIKIKSEFTNSLDCKILSRLLIGIEKIITPENIIIIEEIIEGKSTMTPQDFLKCHEELINYFL